MGGTKRKSGFASRIGRPLLAGALAAGAAAPVPAAAADVFLKLGDILGESQEAKHENEIEILSYTQTFSNSAKIAKGVTTGPGKVVCGAVTLVKNIDRSSSEFVRLVVTGAHVPEGVLTFRKPGAPPLEYYRVTMNDVIVTAVDQVDNADPAAIIEKVTLLADQFVFEYTRQAPGGGLTTTKFGWDCSTNKAL